MKELDLVTTPSGEAVAMVHCNNCTSDLNAWVGLFKEIAEAGISVDRNELYGMLYRKAWKAKGLWQWFPTITCPVNL